MRFSLIQLGPFVRKWRTARLKDEDLQALEQSLMKQPDAGDVIRGTGGLRKIRFAPPSWRRGKSGALRVCYAIYHEFDLIFLVTFLVKMNRRTSLRLSDSGQKQCWIASQRVCKKGLTYERTTPRAWPFQQGKGN